MSTRVGLEGSSAIAEACRLADVDVISAYPITPQTHIVERLAEMVANDELKAVYIPVESEHSAMSALLGTSAVGARSFTATAGQGLELMHEVLYVASAMRLPIVMAVANRALSSPLSVWGDHSDVMATRDCGWIQVFAENNQEVFDLTLWAFRAAEDPQVLLPVAVNLDGFHLSHVTEAVLLPEPEGVKRFLPDYHYPFPLDPAKPVTMGAYGLPFIYSELKKAQEVALRSAKEVILQGWREFGEIFGRHYSPVESYRTEEAKTLLLTMGSFSETAKEAVDKKRAEGEKVGLIKIRLWRPFPFEEFREVVSGAETLIVFDRCISFGGPSGPVASEVRSALYQEEKRPKVVSFIGGLGGRDMAQQDFEWVIERGIEIAEKGSPELYETVGIRG
jgi:pyruvate ferredoxin oxidoreductase alpha subunit